MKYLLIFAVILSPITAQAGLLFGNKTVIHNHNGPDAGYSMRYSSEGFPPYRTFRSYRGSVQSGYLVPRPADEIDPVVTTRERHKEKHKERHRHGRHKSSATTTIRSSQ